jgi:hypothetical protein
MDLMSVALLMFCFFVVVTIILTALVILKRHIYGVDRTCYKGEQGEKGEERGREKSGRASSPVPLFARHPR